MRTTRIHGQLYHAVLSAVKVAVTKPCKPSRKPSTGLKIPTLKDRGGRDRAVQFRAQFSKSELTNPSERVDVGQTPSASSVRFVGVT